MGLSCVVVLSLVASLPVGGGSDVVATAVLEEGRPPRRALRVMHPVGWRLRARLDVDTEWESETDAALRTEFGPEVVVPLTVSLEAVPGREHARYQVEVGRPEVRAADGEGGQEEAWALATELAPLHGSRGGVVLAATGLPVEVDLALGAGAVPALETWVREALTLGWCVTPQFPEQPVGVGARWVVARAHAPAGLAVVTYKLVELRGTRGRVRFRLQVREVGASSGAQSEGELHFDLRSPLPERLDVRYTVREELPEGAPGRLVRRTHVRLVGAAPEQLPARPAAGAAKAGTGPASPRGGGRSLPWSPSRSPCGSAQSRASRRRGPLHTVRTRRAGR